MILQNCVKLCEKFPDQLSSFYLPILDQLNDKWLRIIGISLMLWISISVNSYYRQPFSARMVLMVLLTLMSIIAVWHLMRGIILHYREKYPRKSQIAKRLFFTFLTTSIVITLLFWLTSAGQHWLSEGSFDDFRVGHETGSITINNRTLAFSLFGFDSVIIILNFIFFQTVYEVVFFIHNSSLREKRLRQAEQEREILKAANLQSQLDALKQQVNPHFLFNSLNVLDSLIEDDPPRARLFLEELSTVYRYLLRSNERHLTELDKELDFIQSYYHLLQTRLGDGLQLSIRIDEDYLQYKLPPLTLQLLVENAFKHNMILPDQPLLIDISTDGAGHLLVRNNIQRKNVRVASNGVGLTNILNKYRMLNQTEPAIRENDGHFLVSLPLIDGSV